MQQFAWNHRIDDVATLVQQKDISSRQHSRVVLCRLHVQYSQVCEPQIVSCRDELPFCWSIANKNRDDRWIGRQDARRFDDVAEPLLPGHCACMEDQERIGGACQVMPHLWIRLSGTGFLRPDPVGDD